MQTLNRFRRLRKNEAHTHDPGSHSSSTSHERPPVMFLRLTPINSLVHQDRLGWNYFFSYFFGVSPVPYLEWTEVCSRLPGKNHGQQRQRSWGTGHHYLFLILQPFLESNEILQSWTNHWEQSQLQMKTHQNNGRFPHISGGAECGASQSGPATRHAYK